MLRQKVQTGEDRSGFAIPESARSHYGANGWDVFVNNRGEQTITARIYRRQFTTAIAAVMVMPGVSDHVIVGAYQDGGDLVVTLEAHLGEGLADIVAYPVVTSVS